MSSRLSVIFYIILCLEIGLVLTVLPWVPHGWLGLSDWSNNYFLLLAAHKAGYGVQRFVASGWVRGAVSGIGILNLGMGIWEMINFRKTVRALDSEQASVESSRQKSPERVAANDAQPAKTDPLSDYPRRNH
ncbi:MAG: hypothetical protein QOH42_2036 [Blastocatellia bacterium]|jgi:hypothetical protein|nr:hypothetical protein [Blastocatellia bacterium]MDX6499964.1 hypothetical protein [Blastocatellia bacterium]